MPDLATLNNDDRIATLSLNRPEARNALSIDLIAALRARVDELAAREDVSVVVVTGEGRAFCAGMDLKAITGAPEVAQTLLSSLAELTLALRALPQVSIARVNGAAIGGGCGLACVCDLALTHNDAKMGFPEVDLGVCPAVVAPWLIKRVGAGRARSILLAGGLLSGREAFEVGMVSACVGSREELDAATADLASRLASGGPTALVATKQHLNALDGSLDADAVLRGADLSARVIAGEEAQRMLRQRLG